MPRADDRQVIFADTLAAFLKRRYPLVPEVARAEAVQQFIRPIGVGTLRRNMDFHLRLVKGIEIAVEQPDGSREHVHLHAIDWDDVGANTFEVVNQLPWA